MSQTPDFKVIEGREYQQLGNAVGEAVYRLLHTMHMESAIRHEGAGATGGDGGPIVGGAVSALMQFMSDGVATDDEIRAMLYEQVDAVLPQIRMQRAVDAAGAPEGGHA